MNRFVTIKDIMGSPGRSLQGVRPGLAHEKNFQIRSKERIVTRHIRRLYLRNIRFLAGIIAGGVEWYTA